VPTVAQLAEALDRACPLGWAEPWDRVGLLLGDPERQVERVLVALDADGEAVRAAQEAGAGMLLAHHPLFLRPLERLVASDPTARAVAEALAHGLAVYAAHTNFDVHPEGVGAALADALGLAERVPLRVVGRTPLYQLVVFVPWEHAEALLQALGEAGAGRLGRYRDAAFVSGGEGRWRPLPGARPFRGEVGVLERAPEARVEVVVPESAREAVLEAMRRAHPYEEIAYALVRLDDPAVPRALGLVGSLGEAIRLDRFAAWVARRLGAPATRFVGPPDRPVRRIAVVGGSGADAIDRAREAGADVLVTADVRYHQARRAEALGLALVDPGHQATEAPAVPRLAALARAAWAPLGPVDVVVAPPRPDVWRAAAEGVEGEP
jgi:dinuclear metal center YbgI/SA1388 family protein